MCHLQRMIFCVSMAVISGVAPALSQTSPGAKAVPAGEQINKSAKPCSGKDTVEECFIIQRHGGPDPFKGLHWGLGLAYTSNLGGVGSVKKSAANIVHVEKQNHSAARGAFELHYFFKLCFNPYNGLQDLWKTNYGQDDSRANLGLIYVPRPVDVGKVCHPANAAFGTGPFVSLNTSPFDNLSGKVFDSVGVGWMLGVNAFDSGDASKQHSVNFGIGALIDTGFRELAPGVRDGQVTTLATDQLTRQTTRVGFMMMLSYKILDFNLNN